MCVISVCEKNSGTVAKNDFLLVLLTVSVSNPYCGKGNTVELPLSPPMPVV